MGGVLSPDGRMLAYSSDESGRPEIYVRPFLGPGRPSRVSTDGGEQPRWQKDGKSLFYWGPTNGLFEATAGPDVQTGNFGKPQLLFNIGDADHIAYDIAPDGQRFLISTASHESQNPPDHVITNWTRLLENKHNK